MNKITGVDFDKLINEFVDKFRDENTIINRIIRDEVFEILEQHCIVIYYPLDDEDIDGFHIKKSVNGKLEHFVYINTANTTERQIFAAAHELGHIWKVYQKAKKKYDMIDDYISSITDETPEEYITNKFATQLLIPLDLFKSEMESELKKLNYNGSSISKIDLLRLTISLMNTFFVDYSATIKRFLEIGRISTETFNKVMSYTTEADFIETFNILLKERDYKRLSKQTNTRNISNLTEIIRKAEGKDCVMINTIEKLKNDFAINSESLLDQKGELDFKDV